MKVLAAEFIQAQPIHPLRKKFFQYGREQVFPTLFQRDRDVHFDRQIWRELGRQGLFNPYQSFRDQYESFLGFAEGSMDLPLFASVVAHGAIATELLATFGSEHQKAVYLPKMISGEFIAGVCNSEESAGTDLKGIRSSFKDNGAGKILVNVSKRGNTNVTDADVVFASAWDTTNPEKPTLAVLALERGHVIQDSHNEKLMGFKTGMTGSLKTVESLELNSIESMIGDSKAGFKILKHIFNIERFFTGVAFAGILNGLIPFALEHIQGRKSFGKPLSEFQYVQEKVIAIYSKQHRLLETMNNIMSSKADLTRGDLKNYTKELALLKMVATEDALRASQQFFEVFGYTSYQLDHLAQKLVRDLMAFKMLGGTKEQQKIVLFQELLAGYEAVTGGNVVTMKKAS